MPQSGIQKLQAAKAKIQNDAPQGLQNKVASEQFSCQTVCLLVATQTCDCRTANQVTRESLVGFQLFARRWPMARRMDPSKPHVFNNQLSKLSNKPGNLGIAGGVSRFARRWLPAKWESLVNRTKTASHKLPINMKSMLVTASQLISRRCELFSIGDIISAPADLAGSAAKEASKVLPGELGKQAGQASKVFDTARDVQREQPTE